MRGGGEVYRAGGFRTIPIRLEADHAGPRRVTLKSAEGAGQAAYYRARQALKPKRTSLWPEECSEDTPECAKAFIFDHCKTWDEATGEIGLIPRHPYLEQIVDEWFETKRTGTPLFIEKSRRLVVSWLLCALDVWDAGRRRADIVQGGIDYDKASDFVWRCWFIYEEIRKDEKYANWKLPKPSKWGNPEAKRLDKLAFRNGSVIEPLNSNGESFRGSGYTRVKLEELSAYRYVAAVLSQANAVTEGPPGRIGGHVVCVANASTAPEWQELKGGRDAPRPDAAHPFISRDLEKGRYLGIHYSCDPLKDLEWVLKEKPKWFWAYWNLEMEMMDKESAGALWKSDWFDRAGFRLPAAFRKVGNVVEFKSPVPLVKIVVAIDPSVTDPELVQNPNKSPDECGIGAAGVDENGNGVVLCDFSEIMDPERWAEVTGKVYTLTHASGIYAEKNQGGELVRLTLKTALGRTNIQLVHASIGKRARAEPVAMLYQLGRVKHCGDLSKLESEQLSWDARAHNAPSPNRIDWLVIAFHALGLCEVPGLTVTNNVKKSA